MSEQTEPVDKQLEEIYNEANYWHVNTGGETIHTKRMAGLYRNIKWISMPVWLIYFLGPYIRWDDRQAILWDIPARQFHIFSITLLPQDVWMLAMVLLFFALLLAAATSIAGRVYCGYFCFQTVWTDIFTWLEEKLEGSPTNRHKLDLAPWDLRKIRIKLIKHSLWLLIGAVTGASFTAWFTDAYVLWYNYLTLQASVAEWTPVAVFTFFTYLFAGFMREQVCFWLCPYARIQGVMVDSETILPTYDFSRGEPRGKLKKTGTSVADSLGDCIDCKQCVAVCPTGIDIRNGQQEGCITCGLCIDACDSVMLKIKRAPRLIRYMSLAEMQGKPSVKFYKRFRVLIYSAIMVLALIGIMYGLLTRAPIELKVLHERQPLFIMRSDGSVQNKYVLKILNKTETDRRVIFSVRGHDDLVVVGVEEPLLIKQGDVTAYTIFLRIPAKKLTSERIPVQMQLIDTENPDYVANYQSMFFSSK